MLLRVATNSDRDAEVSVVAMRLTLQWSNARAVRAWCLIHKWTSLICTLFILALCLTGLPLIFKEEINDWLYADAAAATMDGAAPTLSLDRMADTAKQRYPGEFVQFLFWNPDRPHVVTFGCLRDRAPNRRRNFTRSRSMRARGRSSGSRSPGAESCSFS